MADVRQFVIGKNQNINLDDYLNDISANITGDIKELVGQVYTDPTTNKKVVIKEEDLPKLYEANDILYKSLNERPDDIVYNYDKALRGFTDNRGQLNSSNNVYLGLVTSLYGNRLRNMPLYEEKKPTPAIAAVDYNDKALSKIFLNRLLGNASVQDFIEYDPFENGTRLNTERAKRSADVVTSMKNDLASKSNEFVNWTDDQINLISPQLDQLFTIFSGDGKVTDNERLDIARILGDSNINKLYSVGQPPEEYITQQKIIQDEDNKAKAAYIKKLRAIEQQFKPYSGQLMDPVDISDYSIIFGDWNRDKFYSLIANSSDSELSNILSNVLISDDYDITKDPAVRKIWPENYNILQNTKQSYHLLADHILEELERRGSLEPFKFGNNLYYIPDTLTNNNTGLVWDSNNNQILEMSMHDIPYLQNYVNEWYAKTYQNTEDPEYVNPYLSGIYTMKQGGQIRKMAGGGNFFDSLQQSLTGWSEDLDKTAWKSNTPFHGHAGDLSTVKLTNDAYISNFNDVAKDAKDYISTFNNFNTLSAEQIMEIYKQ